MHHLTVASSRSTRRRSSCLGICQKIASRTTRLMGLRITHSSWSPSASPTMRETPSTTCELTPAKVRLKLAPMSKKGMYVIPSPSGERRLERDLRDARERTAHRASLLGLLGRRLERGLVHTRHPSHRPERDRGDGGSLVDEPQRHRG